MTTPPSSSRLRRFVAPLLLLSAVLTIVPASQAQFSLEVVEEDGDVTISYDGSWGFDVDVFTFESPATGTITSTSILVSPGTANITVEQGLTLVGQLPWHNMSGSLTGGVVEAGSNIFGIGSTAVFADPGYTAGTPVSGSVGFTSVTLADLGMTPNTMGNFSIGGTTLNWTATQLTAVPEPSSAAALAGLVSLGFILCRRPRRSLATESA